MGIVETGRTPSLRRRYITFGLQKPDVMHHLVGEIQRLLDTNG